MCVGRVWVCVGRVGRGCVGVGLWGLWGVWVCGAVGVGGSG